MGKAGSSGLVSKRAADWVAGGIFLSSLIVFMALLFSGQDPHGVPSATVTTTSTSQVERGPHGVTQSTHTTERTVADVSQPIWVSLLGDRQTIFLISIASFAMAYLLAAMTQRVLLGRYAITLGPVSMPEITPDAIETPMKEALAAAKGEAGPEEPQGIPRAGSPSSAAPEDDHEESQGSLGVGAPASDRGEPPRRESPWEELEDPNLALAGWRIDLEGELRRIAAEYHLPEREQRFTRLTLNALSDRGIIPHDVANPLQDLLTIANKGVHGAKVDKGVISVLRTEGIQLLKYLKTIRG